MRRLYQRLQLYGLVLSVSLLILWMVVPKTRSHTISVAPPIKNSVQRREVIAKLDHTELLYLKTLFKKADTTSDGKLAVNELTWAIQKTVAKHIQDAMRSNPRTFFKLDKINHNGQVEWTEWLKHFQIEHNIVGVDVKLLPRGLKEKLAAAKAAWSEAARSNPDALNIDEFLSFAHPESSHSALAQVVEEKLARHDLNDDGKISLDEYLDDPVIEFTDEEMAQRQRKFKDMDSNGDGQAERRELLVFNDPKHSSQSKEEAIRLMNIADTNPRDGLLDVEELESEARLFLDSLWVSPEKTFHWDI